ncbi:hypothetical protein ASF84_16975 [Pseudomonas sp. Leaf127]|uniref:deaminase domain-containing protein n=1 Tax=Pseudomonas sp. Leaf127 TaxID=1736267 RepID=UPI000702D74F|nr:deaminase domain-containing protein [Pseudomonas sp. Leaf127]KQQ53511.1 hypothetical protein ASF84_16975 [Pseudomonas sp. Leaf127]
MSATVLQPSTLQTLKTARLFLNIELALGTVRYPVSAERYAGTANVPADEYFRIARLVLTHVLGEDTGFANGNPALPDAAQEHRLAQLYQGEKAWTLCANAVGMPLCEVTPWLVHQFFARMAWLDEASVTTEAARAQLQAFVYGLRPYREADTVVDLEDYPLLDKLLGPVPEDLRHWMVQFKRGARLMPMGEWISRSSGRALYSGLLAQRHEAGRPAMSVFSEVVAAMVPAGDYHDQAVSDALEYQLGTLPTWLSIVFDLQAIAERDHPDSRLQLDVLTPTSINSRVECLRKIAAYVLNPTDEDWLARAIARARQAPGMQLLSLAGELRSRHADLMLEPAMALAAVLLRPVLHRRPVLDEALPTARALNMQVPGLQAWRTPPGADELFRQMGIELLCVACDAAQGLRRPAAQTWHALIQTGQFQTLFAPLLRHLQWYAGGVQGPAAVPVTQALAGRTIIDHYLGATAAFAEPLADTLRRTWVCEYSHVQLAARVRRDIQARQPEATSSTVDMLHYLLLRETLPELLVDGVPDHLQYGRALQSVALIHGVALLEALVPGRACHARFDEVITLSADLAQSSDPAVQAMWASTLQSPALRYATAHGVIEWGGHDDIEQATAVQVGQALNHLKDQQARQAEALNTLLGLKAPDRRQLAQQELTEAGVPRLLWDQAIEVTHWPVLQAHGFTLASTYWLDRLLALGRPQATVVELVMMGEAYRAGEPTIPEAYASAFEAFRQTLVQAQGQVISRLLSEMNPHDRDVLLGSTCEVSRVSFKAGQGRHGVFIRYQRGDHRSDFHEHGTAEGFLELIPAGGVVRTVTQRFDYTVPPETDLSGNIAETVDKQERHAQRIATARVTPLLPLDSDAYLHGRASRSATQYHQPQHGVLVPDADLVYRVDGSEQDRLDTLAQQAARHLFAPFLEQSKAEHSHATGWEERWAKERAYADLAARLIIPFYGCVEDLTQGEHSAGVIIGCVMDVAFALIPVGTFVGATARIIVKAGKLGVVSVLRLTGAALGRLIEGLAQQSTVFALHDLGKITLLAGRLGWETLLREVPALKRLLSHDALLSRGLCLDRGVYRLAEHARSAWPLEAQATVDGRPGVAVRNLGTPAAADFRLLDPQADAVFGPSLTVISATGPLELSMLSAADRIEPGHYPAILPVAPSLDGVRKINIAERCRVHAIERQDGVFDLLIDQQAYQLDTTAPDVALRTLASSRLSSETGLLREAENLCRLRRDLVPVPCNNGVKLSTPAPEPIADGSTSPRRSGKYPSQAMGAREFTLARVSAGGDAASQTADVFVHEGKFCKWADSPRASGSASVPGKAVIALSESERVLFSLPDAPVYRAQIDGLLARDSHFGLPDNYGLEDARWIYEHAPVIELGPIAARIEDARTLRGIRMTMSEVDWVFIEADTGAFYKAPVPADGSLALRFSRVERVDEINAFMRLAEQYRLVRERPGVFTDRDNIARLLFDLRDEAEQAQLGFAWGTENVTYDDYVAWCSARGQKNELLAFAGNILAGEEAQKKFVALARQSIPDFRKVAERSIPEQQHIVEVLNNLLPIQGTTDKWDVLTLESIISADAGKTIIKHIKGANLSFVQAYTESGERIVYYALSGGRKAKAIQLQLDVAESTERVIDGVIYRDARARMAGRAPDPAFTSLPVVRDASRVMIRDFGRELDSERLIATVFKEDLASTRLSHIRVFTLMDTCRSCGGFVLPRLKLDFAQAQFSVTYLRDYTRS